MSVRMKPVGAGPAAGHVEVTPGLTFLPAVSGDTVGRMMSPKGVC